MSVSHGSPPRMRGKHQILPDRSGWRGITPAHAGKTIAPCVRPSHIWDHPRACGENISAVRTSPNSAGSPPRMRGKHFRKTVELRFTGITPAHAGKTQAVKCIGVPARDHPRACGENEKRRACCRQVAGSPPRMRGKHRAFRYDPAVVGITPAHAGKTALVHLHWRPPVDHPRACGENKTYAHKLYSAKGSPPRMRGKREISRIARRYSRITPAHAGKTSLLSCRIRAPRDHPRACGENTSEMAYFRG